MSIALNGSRFPGLPAVGAERVDTVKPGDHRVIRVEEGNGEVRIGVKRSLSASLHLPGLAAVYGMEDGAELADHPAVHRVGKRGVKENEILEFAGRPGLTAVVGTQHRAMLAHGTGLVAVDDRDLEQGRLLFALLQGPGFAAIVGAIDRAAV